MRRAGRTAKPAALLAPLALASRAALAAVTTLAALAALAGCARERPAPPPAVFGPGPRCVVVVSLDCLRADRLHCYGNPVETSPFLDRLAAEGTRFARATCPGNWTLPSHMSLFTGLYPHRHGVINGNCSLAAAAPHLVEPLRAAGWRTAAFTGGGYLAPRYGYERGFETYWAAPRIDGVLDETLARARAWLAEQRGQDVFLFLHTYEIHEPFTPPAEYLRRLLPEPRTDVTGEIAQMRELAKTGATPEQIREIVARYDADILHTDAKLGAFRAALDTLGLGGNLLFVVASDHGEQFWEHGKTGHGGDMLGPELTDVPLIVTLPAAGAGSAAGAAAARAPHGRVLDAEVSFLDIMPTVLDAAGLPAPPAIDGFSLLPALLGGADGKPARAATRARPAARGAEAGQPSARERRRLEIAGRPAELAVTEGLRFAAVRAGGWKLIAPLPEAAGRRLKMAPALYDLRADPRELNPLPARDQVAVALGGVLPGWERLGLPSFRPGQAAVDEATQRQLRALGYVH